MLKNENLFARNLIILAIYINTWACRMAEFLFEKGIASAVWMCLKAYINNNYYINLAINRSNNQSIKEDIIFT